MQNTHNFARCRPLGCCLGAGRARIWALLFALVILCGMPAEAATRIEAWITITNLPNGNTNQLTWNASSNRVWTNLIFNASTQIQTTNNIQNSRTNLKVQLDTYKFRSWHVIQYGTNTNDVIILAGTNEPIAIAIAGLWASVRYVTNTVYISDFVLAPPNTLQSNSFLTWQWSAVATNLERGTQALGGVSIAFTNFPHSFRPFNPPMTNMSVFGGTNRPNDFLGTNGGLRNMWSSNMLATNLTGTSLDFTNFSGMDTNRIITNSPRGNFTHLIATQLYSFGGEANGMNVTNAPWIHSFSNRFDTVVVFSALVATNAHFPGTGVDSQKIGAGSVASGDYSVALGFDAQATTNQATAVGQGALALGVATTAYGQEAIAYTNSASAFGAAAQAVRYVSTALGAGAIANHAESTALGRSALTTTNNQVRIGTASDAASIPGELQADGTTKIVNAVRYTQTGPWSFSEGTYTSMTGGSNNVVQASTNAGTRISGHVSACNMNSLRTGDGMPMAGRRHWVFNAGSSDITLIDRLADGFETQATNRMALPGGLNITLPPNGGLELKYNANGPYWETVSAVANTNVNVSTTGDFSGANTTNVIAFNDKQMQRMTNAMTTNTTFNVSNLVAGSKVEIYVIGANGGVIASNYTFKITTNSLPTASRITWQTNGVALTNGTYDYAVPSNSFAVIKLTAPFATNVFAEFKVGP